MQGLASPWLLGTSQSSSQNPALRAGCLIPSPPLEDAGAGIPSASLCLWLVCQAAQTLQAGSPRCAPRRLTRPQLWEAGRVPGAGARARPSSSRCLTRWLTESHFQRPKLLLRGRSQHLCAGPARGGGGREAGRGHKEGEEIVGENPPKLYKAIGGRQRV